MENKTTSCNSQTYYALKAFLYAFPTYVLLTGILILIVKPLHMPGLGVLLWIVMSSVPFIFQKRFKEAFTRNVKLVFDDKGFYVREYGFKNGYLKREISVFWSDIESFKCSIASGVTHLEFKLRNRSDVNFSFKEEKTQDQIINGESVFSTFYQYIRLYNSGNQSQDNIIVKPGLLASKAGLFILYGSAGLAVFAILIHLVLSPETFGLSFMSFFILIGLIIKRKTDKELFNKIIQLDTKPPTE